MRLLFVVAIAGCGRLGFEADGADAALAAGSPALCDVAKAGSVSLDGAPLALRAVPLSAGYGVVVGTDAGNVYAIRVDAALAVESTHLPMTGGYELQGASQLSDRLFIYANLAPDSYVKALEPTWDTYVTAASGTVATVDPPMASLPGGTLGVLGVIASGSLSAQIVPADLASSTPVDVQLPATHVTLLAHPAGVRVLADDGLGTCSSVVVDASGMSADARAVPDCALAHAATDAAGVAAIAIRRSGELALATVQPDPSIPVTVDRVGPGTSARVAIVDGEPWLAYRDGSVQLARVAEGTVRTAAVADLAGPFDLVAGRVFWLDGGDLRTARPCLAP